jgi:hypothetical protein
MILARLNASEGIYFCASCQKKIYDFRDKSTVEIRETMQMGNICGIFHDDQLKPHRFSLSYRILFIFLALLSFIGFKVKPLRTQEPIQNKSAVKLPVDSLQHPKKEKKSKKKKQQKKTKYRVIGTPSF